MRRFEFVGGSSQKFWEITQSGTGVTVRFGRLGTTGQTQTKKLESDQAAASHAARLIEEKLGKGYVEVTGDEMQSVLSQSMEANRSEHESLEPIAAQTTAGPADLVERLRVLAPTVGPHLARRLLPAVRFASRKVQDSDLRVGSTKLGGHPDLPVGVPWPAWPGAAGGSSIRPLRFFAQVDMSDVATAAPADLGLPSSGLLSFFADFGDAAGGILGLYGDEQQGCRTLLTPPHTPLDRRPSPVSSLPAGALLPIGAWTWPTDPPPDVELPDNEYDALDQLDQDYERTLRAELPNGWSFAGRHQIGGHARYIQHPVEEEVVQAVGGCYTRGGGFDRKRWDEVKDQVADWRLILQIDSDDLLGLMWGDVGTLYWAARRTDITNGVWSSTMFNFQCS